jgi:integrase
VDSFFSRRVFFLDATTGLRRNELLGLRWSDLNFERGEINVVRSVVIGMISHCQAESFMNADTE